MGDPSNQAKSIFLAAIGEHAPEQWPAFLEQACAGDIDLRAEVEKLLRARSDMGSFHEAPSSDPSASPAEPIIEGPGTVIGPYKLMEQIGEGGMGLVFVAEQHHPVRRKVALKVIKPGMDTRAVIARFEAERQALALMDHPNIAKVLDGGTTGAVASGSRQTSDSPGTLAGPATGRPYFVMELVKGVPITEYCDENQVPVRERLELFLHLCHAVQHAHQKGIIHRDLKPYNVMVMSNDGAPVVKVIDFGVAKAVGQQLTEKTIYTQFTQLVGTPMYMSPEQAGQSGVDVDTRTDIYALGVLLYELLTGTTPFDRGRLKDASYEEMRRIIREEEPPKPSTRISTLGQAATTLSTRRKSDPKRLSQLCRGELDWIVMKCLEKDRNRRYETANALAMDLQRYLHDEPVRACPPTTGYRLRKFARKYRTLLRVAGVFVVFLVAATAVSTWQAVRATLAERQALKDRDRAEASFHMARDAVDRLFTQVSRDPRLHTRGMEQFRKDLVKDAKEFYERFIQFDREAPGVRYDLGLAYQRLGEIHRELGDYAAAEESLTKAVALLGELVRAQPDVAEYERDLAASYAALGFFYFDTADWEKAETAYQQALAIQKTQAAAFPGAAQYRYALAKTYRASGFMQHRMGQPEIAAERYQQALDILNKLVQDYPLPEHRSLLATTLVNLATTYNTKGWYDKAETASKEAQRVYGKLAHNGPDALPEHRESLAVSFVILGMAYRGQDQIENAEAAQQQALTMFEKLAQEHPDVLDYAYDMGRCYTELGITANHVGRPDAAIVRYDKAIAGLEGVVDRGKRAARPSLLSARILRAVARAARGDHAEAAAEAEALARQGDVLSIHLYDMCCVFSRASAAANHDAKLSSPERALLRARYADRAIDFLRRAIGQGWGNPQAMKTDHDVEPLRAREDFQKLVADLEAKTKE